MPWRIPTLLSLLAGMLLGSASAETLWRRDWEGIGHDSSLISNALGSPRVSSPEVGLQTLTVVSGSVRTFDHAGVGGYDIISQASAGSTATYELRIALTSATYDPDLRYTMDFVIGTGASANRSGDWFLEFGTVEDGTFTPLPYEAMGESSFQSGSITLDETENFQDDTNFVDRFDYNVGGRHIQLRFVPPPSVTGKTVAFRFGTLASDLFAGFSDMRLDADTIPTRTVTTLDDDADSPPGGSLREAMAAADPGDRIAFDPSLANGTITLDGGQLLIEKDLFIDASALTGGLTISGNGDSRVFDIASGTTVTIDSLRIVDGHATDGDPLIHTDDDEGGGVRHRGHSLTLLHCEVSGNRSESHGGGILSEGKLTIIASTIAGNIAAGNNGGGINTVGETLIENSTISRNQAASLGGGVHVGVAGARLAHVSIVDNISSNNSGGGIRFNSSPVVLDHCLIAGNTASATGPDVFNPSGTSVPTGVNLLSDLSSSGLTEGPNVILAPAPRLGPLADNGGPTMTHLPLPSSPALDAGIGGENTPATDQRGLPRVSGSALDIGAVEVQVPLTDGLLAYWPFDETSGFVAPDQSGGGNDGTLLNFGFGQWVPGQIGNAVELDGDDDWISAVNPLPSPTTDVTFAGWVSLEPDPVVNLPFASVIKNWGNTQEGQFHLGLDGSGQRINNFLTGGTSVIDVTNFAINSWQHLAFTYDGAKHRLYRNGIEVGVGNIDIVTNLTKPASQFQSILGIGAKTGNDGTAPASDPGHWPGRFDEFALWGRALSAAEIQQLHTNGDAGSALYTPASLEILNWQELKRTGDLIDLAITWASTLTTLYRIEFSADGADWTTIPPIDDIPATGDHTSYQFTFDTATLPTVLVRVAEM